DLEGDPVDRAHGAGGGHVHVAEVTRRGQELAGPCPRGRGSVSGAHEGPLESAGALEAAAALQTRRDPRRSTGVEKPGVTPAARTTAFQPSSERSRGFVISSMAKLIMTRAKPTRATHTPVGTMVHQDSVSSAWLFAAQYRFVPQVTLL